MTEIEMILKKIIDADSLPTRDEAIRLATLVEQQQEQTRAGFTSFCRSYNTWEIYTLEFVDALATEIKRLGLAPILEICAGSGKLSHQLRKRGVGVVATDDYSWKTSARLELVERLNHLAALRKYQPRLVVACWTPPKSSVPVDVLDFPSVSAFIDINQDDHGTEISDALSKRVNFNKRFLNNVIPSINLTSYINEQGELIIRPSIIELYTRT